jgi:hypothetical protein
MLAARDLLDAWERGDALPVPDRAPSLLALLDSGCAVDELTVGQSDALLFGLRTRLFGSGLDASAPCPSCAEMVSITLSLDDIAPELGEPPEWITSVHDGYRLTACPPSNRDFSVLSGLGASIEVADVVRRCLVDAFDPTGNAVTVADVPDHVLTAVLEDLAAADPAANIILGINCVCGAAWTDQLDIRAVLWADLDEWASRLLTTVHDLARGYGWSEAAILGLSGWRREWYRQALEW